MKPVESNTLDRYANQVIFVDDLTSFPTSRVRPRGYIVEPRCGGRVDERVKESKRGFSTRKAEVVEKRNNAREGL